MLGAKIIEAELLGNTTAEVIREALPFKARGEFREGELVISSPVYVSLADHACKELSPGDIAFRTVDQAIIIGCEQADLGHSSAVWMADMINVFAHALTDVAGMGNNATCAFSGQDRSASHLAEASLH